MYVYITLTCWWIITENFCWYFSSVVFIISHSCLHPFSALRACSKCSLRLATTSRDVIGMDLGSGVRHMHSLSIIYLKKGTTSRKKQEADGISVWIIQLVRVVSVPLVGFFIYLMFGLWFLPVTKTVEEVPVYLYDFLVLLY